MVFRITNQSLIDKFIDFVNGISKTDRIAILHDGDADGLCSGIITDKSLKRLNKSIVFISDFCARTKKISEDNFKQLKANKVSHVFVLDIPIDMDSKSLEYLNNFKSVIIDHHQLDKNNVGNVLLIKPQLFTDLEKPNEYCTSKLAYDLFSRLLNIGDMKWISLTGVVGDYCWKLWEKFLKEGFKEYNLEWDDYLYNTKPGYICKLIEGAAALKEETNSLEDARDLLSESNTINEAIIKLEKFKFVLDKIDYYINNFEELAEKIDGAYILEVKEEYSINGAISTALSTTRLIGKLIIIIGEREDRVRISTRCNGGKWDCNKLVKKCLEGLDGNGGGHIPAAGGNVSKKDFPKFMKNIINEIKNSQEDK